MDMTIEITWATHGPVPVVLHEPFAFDQLIDHIRNTFKTLQENKSQLTLQYKDDEGDHVVFSSNSELKEAIELAQHAGRVLRVHVTDGSSQSDSDFESDAVLVSPGDWSEAQPAAVAIDAPQPVPEASSAPAPAAVEDSAPEAVRTSSHDSTTAISSSLFGSVSSDHAELQPERPVEVQSPAVTVSVTVPVTESASLELPAGPSAAPSVTPTEQAPPQAAATATVSSAQAPPSPAPLEAAVTTAPAPAPAVAEEPEAPVPVLVHESKREGPVQHHGHHCAHCGANPIAGIRWACTACPGVSLCSSCESLDVHPPAHVLLSLRLPALDLTARWDQGTLTLATESSGTAGPADTPVLRSPPSKVPLGAAFVRDATVPDGTTVHSGAVIDKRWVMRNTGRSAWPLGCELVHCSGPLLPVDAEPVSVPVTGAGEEATITARLQVPHNSSLLPQTSRAYYRLCDPQGARFGPVIWVDVLVQPAAPASSSSCSLPEASAPPLELEHAVSVPSSSSSSSSAVTPLDAATYASQLASLRAMGFTNDAVNQVLLQEHGGDTAQVVASLVRWAAAS